VAGSSLGLFKVLYQHLSVGNEKNDGNHQSRQPVSWLRTEAETSGVWSSNANNLAAIFGLIILIPHVIQRQMTEKDCHEQ
jgi:hypothetical protein